MLHAKGELRCQSADLKKEIILEYPGGTNTMTRIFIVEEENGRRGESKRFEYALLLALKDQDGVMN